MAKTVVVALLVLTLSTIVFADTTCKRCGYVKKHTHYPPYSRQLQDAIAVASDKTKIELSKADIKIINKIIWKEDRSGNLNAMSNGCYGLGQGKKGTYKSTGVPWKTTCPIEQVMMILLYVKGRYKTFGRAWAHHIKYNWY
jgi:hypothetical protein